MRNALAFLAGWFCLGAAAAEALPNAPSPTEAEALVKQWLEKTSATAIPPEPETLDRTETFESLDGRNRVKERKQRVLRVCQTADGEQTTLTSVNGKPPTPQEARREAAHARKSGRDSKESKHSFNVAPENVRDFSFSVDAVTNWNGRTVWSIRFEPRLARTPKTASDRVLAALDGRLWLDPVHIELAGLEARLNSRVSLGSWGLAHLDQLALNIQCAPIAEGRPWFARQIDFDAAGSHLLGTFHVRGRVDQAAVTVNGSMSRPPETPSSP